MPNDRQRFSRHSRDSVTSRLRLRDHDYSGASVYFVTVCTAHRASLFGEIRDSQMVPSDAGVVVDSWWHTIPGRSDGVLLDESVVMPNHLHGIIALRADPEKGTRLALSDVLGWFKTRTVNDYGLGVRAYGWPPYAGKLWQPGYYDYIIRSEAALDRVRAYIQGNPARWEEDEENPARRLRPG